MVKNNTAKSNPVRKKSYHLEFLNTSQKMAWAAYEQCDVLFLIGPAGTAKTHLAMAFAISDILSRKRKKIILTRPVVEAGGERLGFLPGTKDDKINPYVRPLNDCIERCVGEEGEDREKINHAIETDVLAFLRGRTFYNSVCILDEAQNANIKQLKLFLTRLGENSKFILTADPDQSDLPKEHEAIMDVVKKLESVPGIGIVKFDESSIVRHPLVARILEKLG